MSFAGCGLLANCLALAVLLRIDWEKPAVDARDGSVKPSWQRTIMIMAGGTGGHVFPGLAVADHLREAGGACCGSGRRRAWKATLVPKRGYDMPGSVSRACGQGAAGVFLLLPLRLLVAFGKRARDPSRIAGRGLGMGGYISFPAG